MAFAAEFGRRGRHVDADRLRAAGAQAPNFGRRERGGGDARLRRRADREGRGKRGFATG
jgi:hypothetical protein